MLGAWPWLGARGEKILFTVLCCLGIENEIGTTIQYSVVSTRYLGISLSKGKFKRKTNRSHENEM